MHRLPDLPLNVQTALVCATLLAAGSVMARGMLAFYRHWLAVPHQYPQKWNYAHIRILDQFRIAMGFALTLTWAVLFVASPGLPSSAPFGLLQALLTIVLLLLTSAWVQLAIPSEWKHTFVGKMKFEHALGCLMLLWVGLLAGSLFAIARSATFPEAGPVHVIGRYA